MRNKFEANCDEGFITIYPPKNFPDGSWVTLPTSKAWIAMWICFGSNDEEGLGILIRIARRFIKLHYWWIDFKQARRNKKGIKAI